MAESTNDVGLTFSERAWLAWHALPRNEKGRPPRQAQLEREFGIGQGTISRLFSGYIKTVEAGTLIKLARALGVDPTWLASGVGTRPKPSGVVPPMPGTLYAPETHVEFDERYPNRILAASIARRGGVAEEAIRSVLGESHQSEDDPPELWWIDRMRMREHMLKSQEMPGKRLEAPLSGARPVGSRER